MERLAHLSGRLARLQIDGEAQAHTRRARELVLPQARGLAGFSDNVADLGRCQGFFAMIFTEREGNLDF